MIWFRPIFLIKIISNWLELFFLLYHTGYGQVLEKCMNEKSVFFFASFFRNISKTAEIILIEKIGRNHGISFYKKALISEHRKNHIFRDINYFVKMSVSTILSTLRNVCGRTSSKTSVNIKTKFHMSFWCIEIKSWLDFGRNRTGNKGEEGG